MNADGRVLRGKRIAVLAADGFEYIELVVPRRALRLAGATVEVISIHAGKIRGMNLTEPTAKARVDWTLDQIASGDYDALCIPGGFVGPDLLRQSRQARTFVAEFDATKKPMATMGHGPWLLVSAELVGGRRLAAWPGIRDDIVHAGGIWRDESVVHDGNWLSCRGPHDFRSFIPALIEHCVPDRIRTHGRVGRPSASDGHESSPGPEAPVSWALTGARILPKPSFLRTLAAAAVGTAFGAIAHRTVGG